MSSIIRLSSIHQCLKDPRSLPRVTLSSDQNRMAVRSRFCFLFVVHLLHLFRCLHTAPATSISVLKLGGDPRGALDSSPAFQMAWSTACSSSSPSLIYVPPGSYLVRKPLLFSGACRNSAVSFRVDGTLVAPSDYRLLGSSQSWITFLGVKGVSISGGVLDARGSGLWSCKASRAKNCPAGATTLEISNSEDMAVEGLSSVDSQMFHIVVHGSRNVKIQGVRVTASGSSPNTDGIHVELSSHVSILDSAIRTGDDCVSIGPGTSNLYIANVRCGPGHGISIGSLGKKPEEPGVENVTVKSVTFTKTQNGVRIKTWGRRSSGFVRYVLFKQLTMIDVQNPIIIDQNYCPGLHNCPGQESGVRITNVTYEDIHGTSASQVAVKFDCSSTNPCTAITVNNVNLSYGTSSASVSCVNVAGRASGLHKSNSCL